MIKIICWTFGHKASALERGPDYFMRDMVLKCVRCGHKENILERMERYSSPFPIFLDPGFREPIE